MRNLIIVAIVIIVGLVVLRQALYVVDVTEQVIILRFGEVVDTRTTPGSQRQGAVRRHRRSAGQADPEKLTRRRCPLPDQDKENLVIETSTRATGSRTRCSFRKTLQTESTARSRLGDIVTSTLRDRVALRDRTDIIGAKPQVDENGVTIVDEEGLPLVEAQETRTGNPQRSAAPPCARHHPAGQLRHPNDRRAHQARRLPRSRNRRPSITRMRAERNRIACPGSALRVRRKTARSAPPPTAIATSSWPTAERDSNKHPR